jgi:hypothetical protein
MRNIGAIASPRTAGRQAKPHRSTRPRRATRPGTVAAGLGALALLVAGCGGSSPGSGVAHLGSSTASTGSSTGSGVGAVSSSGSSPGGEAQPGAQAIAYSACMRAHGVPNFPDPQITQHGNEVSVRVGINPSISGNPHFESAQQACRKLQPGGGPGSSSGPPISQSEQAEYLKAAACIRAHGLPNFPDPTFSGGGVHVPKTAGINPHSPQVRAAEEACQALIPGGLHGNH